MIVVDFLKYVCRSEFLMVVHEDIGSCYHLSVNLAPCRLCPACVGYGEMEAFAVEIVPVPGSDYVSERVGEVMGDHFRFAGGAGREIHQHDVIIRIGLLRTYERSSAIHTFVEIQESFRAFRSDADYMFEARAFRHGIGDVFQYHFFSGSHYHLDGSGFAAVDDVLFREQVSGRDGYSPDFVQGYDREPEFVAAFQYQHDLVSAAYAQALEP